MRRTVRSQNIQNARRRMQGTGYVVQVAGRTKFCILNSIFFLLFTSTLQAQEIKVRAKFSTDSIKIGKPIEFYLSAHYPSKLNLLFPDSSYSFAPFEFEKKSFTTTKTKDGISKDSVTYTLTTYEVDSVQTLKLPVFVVNTMDCVNVFSNTDTVYFQHLVKSIPDSLTTEKLPLKVNTNYLNVSWNLNYILGGIAIGILFIAAILVWIFFGKQIRRYFKLKRMTKGYEAFVEKFDNSLHRLESGFSPQHAEATLIVWKNYLETLLMKPYTKSTSKEIRQMEQSEKLGQALSTIDRMIYGHMHDNIGLPFADLKEHVRQQFEKKKAEVNHG